MAIDYSAFPAATQAAFARLTAAGVANQAAADARNEQLARQRQEAQVALKAKYDAQRAAVIPFVAGKPGDAAFDEAILEGLGPKWKALAQGRLATRAAQQAKSPEQLVADATYRRFDWETPGSALKEKGWGEIGSLSAQTQGAAAARGLIGIDPTNNISFNVLRDGIKGKVSGVSQGANTDPESGYKLSPQQMIFLGGAGVPSKNDLFFQTELKGMGLTANSSDAQLAAGYDAVARGQQYKNQLPKRGADFGGIGNFFFRKVLPVVAGFINPLLGAAVGASTGALAGRGKALPIISGAATGYGGGKLLRTGVYEGPTAALKSLNPFQKSPTPTTVPGGGTGSTGITTPARGGGLTTAQAGGLGYTGPLASLGKNVGTVGSIGVLGNTAGTPASLLYSPLALAGGATPSVFSTVAAGAGAVPLPSGTIPGTNINVGSPFTTASGRIPGLADAGGIIRDAVQDPLVQDFVGNLLSPPPQAGLGALGSGGGFIRQTPYARGGDIFDPTQNELDQMLLSKALASLGSSSQYFKPTLPGVGSSLLTSSPSLETQLLTGLLGVT